MNAAMNLLFSYFLLAVEVTISEFNCEPSSLSFFFGGTMVSISVCFEACRQGLHIAVVVFCNKEL